MASHLAAARWYAQSWRWPVFPVQPRGKLPLIINPHPKDSPERATCKGQCGQDGHGFHDATLDLDKITAWWTANPDANIGVPTGPESGIAVVDIDPRAGGEDSLEKLEARIGSLPETLTQFTGGDGLHLIYRHPGHKIPSKAGAFAANLPGIDSKGDGGYIVATPSIHPSGNPYVWSRPGGQITPLAPYPRILAQLLDPPRKPRPAPSMRPTGSGYAEAALNAELDRVREAQAGTRNDTLNTAAFNLGQLVGGGQLDHNDVRAELLKAAEYTGLGNLEAENTVLSGLRAGEARPRGGAA
jgi:hypothetical protein